MGTVLSSHKYILSLPRLGLSPVLPSSEVPSFSTFLQDTLLYCNVSVYQLGLSHAPMVCGWMMFSESITKVHVSWFTFDLKVILFHSIANLIKAHIHGFCSFLFDGSSHDTIFRGIFCDDFSGLLWVSHLSQGCPNYLKFLGILE